MKILLKVMAAFSLLSCCHISETSSSLPITYSEKQIFEIESASSVVINMPSGFGSGTVIYADNLSTYVLTCAHVVFDELHRPPLEIGVVKANKYFTGKLEKYDIENDLALIKISKDTGLKAIKIAKQMPVLFSRVYMMGAPLGEEHTASSGVLSDISEDKTAIKIIGGFIMPGISGGTIANSLGELIAVPQSVRVYQGVPQSSFGNAIALSVIKDFLKDYKL